MLKVLVSPFFFLFLVSLVATLTSLVPSRGSSSRLVPSGGGLMDSLVLLVTSMVDISLSKVDVSKFAAAGGGGATAGPPTPSPSWDLLTQFRNLARASAEKLSVTDCEVPGMENLND